MLLEADLDCHDPGLPTCDSLRLQRFLDCEGTHGPQRSSPAMRYFNHIRDGERLFIDEEGTEAINMDMAKADAIAAARDMLIAERFVRSPEGDQRVLEVVDAKGRLVLTVPFKEAYWLN